MSATNVSEPDELSHYAGPIVSFCLLHPDAKLPTRGSSHAAGYDLYALEGGRLPGVWCENVWGPGINESQQVVRPSRIAVCTGIAPILPEGFEMQIRPRSGLALKHGVTVLNTPGTVDEDYHGEVKVILVNLSDKDFMWQAGDRIAQAVFRRVDCVRVREASEAELEAAKAVHARGEAGFGSTGQ